MERDGGVEAVKGRRDLAYMPSAPLLGKKRGRRGAKTGWAFEKEEEIWKLI